MNQLAVSQEPLDWQVNYLVSKQDFCLPFVFKINMQKIDWEGSLVRIFPRRVCINGAELLAGVC